MSILGDKRVEGPSGFGDEHQHEQGLGQIGINVKGVGQA